MKLYSKTAVALWTIVVLGLLAACGGGAERPTQSELTETLISGEEEFPEEMAECMAGVLIDSDISNEALRALVDGEQDDFQGNEADVEARDAAREVFITECVDGHGQSEDAGPSDEPEDPAAE